MTDPEIQALGQRIAQNLIADIAIRFLEDHGRFPTNAEYLIEAEIAYRHLTDELDRLQGQS